MAQKQAKTKTITVEDAREALREVYDPEIPVNVVDLGLIYDIDVKGNNVSIQMTLTARGCGMGPFIAQQAEDALTDLPGVKDVNVELVWDPPWSVEMVTPEGKKILGLDE